jgi:hypothetical protein
MEKVTKERVAGTETERNNEKDENKDKKKIQRKQLPLNVGVSEK